MKRRRVRPEGAFRARPSSAESMRSAESPFPNFVASFVVLQTTGFSSEGVGRGRRPRCKSDPHPSNGRPGGPSLPWGMVGRGRVEGRARSPTAPHVRANPSNGRPGGPFYLVESQGFHHHSDMLPERKSLPHGMPSWVANGADYFITICALSRGENFLCYRETADRL